MATEAREVKESGQGKKYTKKKNKSVRLREMQKDWSLQSYDAEQPQRQKKIKQTYCYRD